MCCFITQRYSYILSKPMLSSSLLPQIFKSLYQDLVRRPEAGPYACEQYVLVQHHINFLANVALYMWLLCFRIAHMLKIIKWCRSEPAGKASDLLLLDTLWETRATWKSQYCLSQVQGDKWRQVKQNSTCLNTIYVYMIYCLAFSNKG